MVTENSAHHRARIIFGLLVCAIYAAWITYHRNTLLVDPDTAWHIAAGRDMLGSWQFPQTDPYSYTFAGQPWIAKEWLSQILLYASFAMSGWSGPAALAIISTTIFVAMLYSFSALHLKPQIAVVITLVALTASCSTFLARPHIFALPLTLLWAWYLFDCARRCVAPRFYSLLILVVWANLHGSFTLGWLIAGLAFITYCERSELKDRSAIKSWVMFLLLCPLACLIHPYGYKAALMTLSVTSGNEVTPYLMEWAPFSASIDIPNLAILLAMAGLAFVTGFRLSPAKSLFALAMLYMFLAHSRFAYLFFAIVPVIVAPDIARQFPSLSIEQWQRQALDSLESQLARTYRLVAVALGGILMCCIALVCTVLPVQRDPSLAVEEALGFARANSLRGHVLNTYNLGGALILEGTPTYIDGRSDQLFQSGFFLRDMASMQSPQILAKALAQYDIQWTLLRPADGRIKMLDATTGWKRVYEDQYAIIHAKQP